MKILHVVESLKKENGGAAEIVPRISESICGGDNSVRVVALSSARYSSTVYRAQEAGVEFLFYPPSRNGLLGAISYSAEFKKAIDENVAWADVVHVHGLWEYPVWAAEKVALKLRKPLIVMPHGSLEPERIKKGRLKKFITSILLDLRFMNRATYCLVTAESERDGVVAYGVKSPVRVIPLGIDSGLYGTSDRDNQFLESLGADPRKKILLYFSRITPIKGLDILAHVWSKLAMRFPEWQLLIVGPDDRGYTDEMKELYGKICNPGSYVFHGPIYDVDKYRLLNSIDVLVLPTRSENFSIAVAEAMSSRKPVVVTKGAPWRVIDEYRAGIWTDISESGVLDGLERVLVMSEGCRREMGDNGRRCVEENFDWNVIGKQLVQLYNDAICLNTREK